MFKKIAAIGMMASLAACSAEVGNETDAGTFGNATMNNQLVMKGELEYAVSLNKRFAAEVPQTVNFAFNSTQLDPAARAALDRQAEWIRQFPEVKFRVYGHTDKVGSNAYNRRLGQRRANAVVRYLSQRGIKRSRLEALVSYGETRPLVDTEARERRNRRTMTEVSGFVRRHPAVLDGKYAQIIIREYVRSGTSRTTLTGRRGTGGFAEKTQ